MKSKIKKITKIVIPYDHEDIDLKCDFIFQTAKQLSQKKIRVTILLRHHFLWFPFFIIKLILLKPSANDSYLSLIPTPLLFPKFLSRFQKIREINRKFTLFIWKKIIQFQRIDIFWNFDPFNIDLLKTIKNNSTLKLFDCVDYYTSIDLNKKKEVENAFHESLKLSDIVFANSQTLYKFCKKFNSNTHLTLQGFDHDTFRQTKPSHSYPELQPDKQVKIGYIGNLTYRIDFDLLRKIISNHPHFLFLLSDAYLPCIPEDLICKTQERIAELKQFKNIYWIPRVSRKTLIPYMQSCDIFIVPYNNSYKFNTYSYPMKIMEYFYFGKPVISTPIKELKRFTEYIKTPTTYKEWAVDFKYLLSHTWPIHKQKIQKKIAIDNSWDNKIKLMLSFL